MDPIYQGRSVLDAHAISQALKLPQDVVIKEFRDGRVASRFTEHWGAKLYGYRKHSNSNESESESDGELNLGELFEANQISVKSLTMSGVKFQNSRFIGSGRNCTDEDLKNSINGVDNYLIVDISKFPELRFIAIKSLVLLRWIESKRLTVKGLTIRKFYEELEKEFQEIKYEEKQLDA